MNNRIDQIPSALRDRPQWVLWRLKTRDGDTTKMPFQPDGSFASSTDPDTWTDFETAFSAYRDGDFTGLGFVFSEDDFLVGIDLDDCVIDGELTDAARRIVEGFDSFAEWSPSGTGAHVICRGVKPTDECKAQDVPGMKEVEIYETGRYFTVTGDRIEGRPTEVNVCRDALQEVCDWAFGTDEEEPPEAPATADPDPHDIGDRDLVAKAKAADDCGLFERLWSGDTSGYPSHSEARLAFANKLAFWTGGDKGRMLSLFKQSSLCRGPDDIRTFKQYEIPTALDGASEFYDPTGVESTGQADTRQSADDASDFTLGDLRDALDGKEGKEAELAAYRLTADAVDLSVGDLHEAKVILEDHGARAKESREWMRDVKKEKKKQQKARADSRPKQPSDLKRGELTAWIAEQVQEDDHFALGRDGGLYYYEGGRYHEDGDRYLKQRITTLLEEEGMTEENTSYRRNEVRDLIEITARELWDEPPRDRLNLLNGILNLETGELEEHAPDRWLSTRQVPIEHDPDADGQQWEDFLSTVFPGDDPAELGYEVMAYLLLPPKGRHRAIHLHGDTETGKSTFIRNFVEGVMGDDSVKSWPLQDLDENDFAAATLLGTSLNVCSDLPSRPMKGTSMFKQLTGGDWITAQRKYEDPFTFRPATRLLFSGNGPIVAPGGGEAFWSRWHVIPFETHVGEGSPYHADREVLDAALQDPQELSALLNELLRVLPRVRESGIEVRPCMADALAQMRGHPENDLPHHSGDGAPPADTQEEVGSQAGTDPQESPPEPPHPATQRDTPPQSRSENFEKADRMDTGQTCPEESVSKTFANGDTVRLPDGQIGDVERHQEGTDPPMYVVRVAEGETYAYTAAALTPVDGAPEDEAPF